MSFIQSSTSEFWLTERKVQVVCKATDLGNVGILPGGFVIIPNNKLRAIDYSNYTITPHKDSGDGANSKWTLTIVMYYKSSFTSNKNSWLIFPLLYQFYLWFLLILSFLSLRLLVFSPLIPGNAAQITITITNRGLPQPIFPNYSVPHP